MTDAEFVRDFKKLENISNQAKLEMENKNFIEKIGFAVTHPMGIAMYMFLNAMVDFVNERDLVQEVSSRINSEDNAFTN